MTDFHRKAKILSNNIIKHIIKTKNIMNKNTLDKAIESFNVPEEEYRVRGIVIFDYYLTKYSQVVTQRLADNNQFGIGRKAMTNFFFTCLNSVSEKSYGLFDIITRFNIVSGWQQRLVSASYVDAERLENMMPTFRTTNGYWTILKGNRHRIWRILGNQSVAELIGSSSLAEYAAMVDEAIKNVIEKLPTAIMVEFKTKGLSNPKLWIDWLKFTTQTNFMHNVPYSHGKVLCNVRNLVSTKELLEDKELLLKNL